MTLTRIIIIIAIIVIVVQGICVGIVIKYVGDRGVKSVAQRIWNGFR